jgi:putative ABC transport system substrate-binding protein
MYCFYYSKAGYMNVSKIALNVLTLGVAVVGTVFMLWQCEFIQVVPPFKKRSYKVAIVRWELSDNIEKIAAGIVHGIRDQAPDDVEIQYLHAGGDRIQLQAVIEKAVNEDVDMIVTIGTASTQMAKETTIKRNKLIPVVLCGTGDPIKTGIVSSFENHGGHVTGYCIAGFDFVKPMIDQLKVFAPRVKKILIPYDPTALGGTLEEYRLHIGNELEQRGYEVADVKVYHTNEVVEKVQPFIDSCDMIWVLPDITVLEAMEGLGKLCEQYQKYSYVTMNLMHLARGAALAFGYDIYELGVDSGRYVRRILNGEKPQDLPVLTLQPSRFKIGINIENARKQGMLPHIDPALLYVMGHGVVIASTPES